MAGIEIDGSVAVTASGQPPVTTTAGTEDIAGAPRIVLSKFPGEQDEGGGIFGGKGGCIDAIAIGHVLAIGAIKVPIISHTVVGNDVKVGQIVHIDSGVSNIICKGHGIGGTELTASIAHGYRTV